MRMTSCVTFLAAVLFAATESAQGAPPPSSQELASVVLPPALDRVLRNYEAAWRRGDALALAQLFAEDGFVLQGGRPPVRGRTAIQAAYARQGGGALRLRALAASAADTAGFIVGAYGYADTPGDQGKFTLTLRRQRGGPWLTFSDMDNASRQPGRADTMPAAVVQRFVDAANARDLAAMIALVAPDAVFASFPGGAVLAQSRDSIHAFYARMMPRLSPGFRITVRPRIVEGALVIDQEHFTGSPDEQGQATWIYQIRGGLIHRAWVLDGLPAPTP